MTEFLARPPPKVERTGNIVVLTLSQNARTLGSTLADDLEGRSDYPAGCHLLLDFTHVRMVGSEGLGTLMGLSKRLRACGGQLTLFNLSAPVYEAFEITRLHTVLRICRPPL